MCASRSDRGSPRDGAPTARRSTLEHGSPNDTALCATLRFTRNGHGLCRRSAQERNAGAMTATRRLAAILAADVAGYSRLMGADEEGTLERLKALRRELIDPRIAEHHGRIVKTTGDGMLVEFASVVDAVRCA